jgi:hypothetical protein
VIRGGDKKLLKNESRLENADQGRQDRQFSRHPHSYASAYAATCAVTIDPYLVE